MFLKIGHGLVETDFVDPEEEAKRPKEISNEQHIDKTVAPPKAYLNTWDCQSGQTPEEATGSPPSPFANQM